MSFVLKILKESILFTFSNWRVLFKLLLIPLILNVKFEILHESFLERYAPFETIHVLCLGIKFLLVIFSVSLWVPQWIQYYADSNIKLHFFQFGAIEGKFFRYALLVLLFLIGPLFLWTMGVSLLSSHEEGFSFLLRSTIACLPSLAIGLWLILKISARFSFIEPSISLLNSDNLRDIWKQTRPYQTQLICAQTPLAMFIILNSYITPKSSIVSLLFTFLEALVEAVIAIYVTKIYLIHKKGSRF